MEKKAIIIHKAREIFVQWKKGLSSFDGLAIPDCRRKEVMVITRFGGDVLFVFFDSITGEIKFFFVAEMAQHRKRSWNYIFRKFTEIKAKLK